MSPSHNNPQNRIAIKNIKANATQSTGTKIHPRKKTQPEKDHLKRRRKDDEKYPPKTKKKKPKIMPLDDSWNDESTTTSNPTDYALQPTPSSTSNPELRDAHTENKINTLISTPSTHNTSSTLAIALSEQYNLTSLNILTSTKMHTKVTQVLDIFRQFPLDAKTRDHLVLLRARPKACVKLISIVEIIKREVSQVMQGKWFQYTVLDQVLEEKLSTSKNVTPLPKSQAVGGDSCDNNDQHAKNISDCNTSDNEEESAFETMKTPFERAIFGAPKKRVQPILNIYLSRTRIENLRKTHG